ncbi:MAG: hypothetical protein GF309_08130 [Candidatus Lokiarchaeota archaeon]|nr:hypothetical protein [Candidatus Lokiarchaeota archaeon]
MMELKIHLEFANADTAKRILQSIGPDNEPLPIGLSIDSQQTETSLQFSIDCARGIDSLRHTFEDLMGAIDLSLRTTQRLDSQKA